MSYRLIREVLDARVTEREVLGVWRRIQDRRRSRGRPVLAAVFAAVAMILCALVAVRVLRPVREGDGPLGTARGASLHSLAGGDEISERAELSDGSRVVVSPGARLSVLENSGRTFVTHLAAGRASFSVKPGGPRRWIVECGRATIEVVGTEFTVERSGSALSVEVRHGVVLVRGDDVPDRVRRVTAGESLRVVSVPPATTASSPSAAPTASTAPSSDAIPAGSAVASSAAPMDRSVRQEPKPPTDEVAALYDDADRARRAGRPRDAATLLEEALSRETRGHRPAIAAFTLGRLYLDQLGTTAPAVHAFERALLAGPPLGLEEDVRARLVEARAKMGDFAGARRAATDYRTRFPAGQRAAEVERWSPSE